MVKINITGDCGNSPRRAFLKDFNIAFAGGDVPFIMDHVTEDVIWEMPGDRTIRGKAGMQTALEEIKDTSMDEMTLDKIITHGRDAAVSGRFSMQGKEYAFCDVYTFAGAKGSMLKSISSFIVKISG